MSYVIDTTKTGAENEALMEQYYADNYTIPLSETAKNEMVASYAEIRLMKKQEEDKIKAFNEAKQLAFQAFEVQKDEERQILNTAWQEAEDNDYTPI